MRGVHNYFPEVGIGSRQKSHGKFAEIDIQLPNILERNAQY